MPELQSPAPEYSYIVDVASLPGTGIERPIRPTPEERAAIAARLGLQSLDSFEIRIRVVPWRGSGAKFHGSFEADVVQSCVVTLEPVPSHVSDEFDVRFLPAAMLEPVKPGEEPEFIASEEDAPEPLGGETGSSFDAGDIAVQYLSLALDPYPRAEGAEIPAEAKAADEPSPFAVLAALKAKDKDK